MFAVDERNHSRAVGFACPKHRVWVSSIAAVVLGALLMGPQARARCADAAAPAVWLPRQA